MCGICGMALPSREQTPDAALLDRMTDSLAHRGPDGRGTWIADHVGLGHRRLAIIGVDTGTQPMRIPSRDIAVTFNGEIYNFRDLRKDLESQGAVFRTESDTEVLLHGYATWGMDGLLTRLVGMFAFGLWDGQERRLYLVRDRLGVKPLYWAEGAEGALYFASELRALRSTPVVHHDLNETALLHYLTLGYVVGENAILKGVRQLAPGTVLTWCPGSPPQQRCYWNLAEIWTTRQASETAHAATVAEEFNHLLDQAIGDRLESEVPLGAFLSGGLDSSLICARMLSHRSPLKTFSMGFEERSYSELPWARLVAEKLGTAHHDATVTCDDPALLMEVARHLDEPFADTSILPTYVLCREARKHLTVALSGDGGDELLAGYTTHAADRLHRAIHAVPTPLLAAARGLVMQLPDQRSKVGPLFKLKQFLGGAHRNACDAHGWWRMLQSEVALRALVSPDISLADFDALAPFRAAYDAVPALTPLDRMLYVDYTTWLASDILVKVDRASMAHGLEVRSPFLDHRLVEFCAGLPADEKLRGLRGKYLMRRVARGQVPDGVIRRKKAGFNSPVSHWIAGPWKELVHDTLLSHDTLPFLRAEGIRAMLEAHQSGKRDHGYRLFALVMLALWSQHHGDR